MKNEQSESSANKNHENSEYKSEEGTENGDQEKKESFEDLDPEIKFPLISTKLLFNFNTVQLFYDDLGKIKV